MITAVAAMMVAAMIIREAVRAESKAGVDDRLPLLLWSLTTNGGDDPAPN